MEKVFKIIEELENVPGFIDWWNSIDESLRDDIIDNIHNTVTE